MTQESSPCLRVVSGGVLTTVQDLGRHAARRYGVPQSGALDPIALELANRLLDNPPAVAALEITAGGAAFEVLKPTLLALTGADFGAQLDDEPLPMWTVVYARMGMHVRLAGRGAAWGARSYLAIAGGVAVPFVLGSRSTYLSGGFGGFHGRPLRAGDVVCAADCVPDVTRLAGRTWPLDARPPYRAEPTLRMLPGPHLDRFTVDAPDRLFSESFQISASSNRMGYRLEGPVIPYAGSSSVPSLGVLPGVIQVPPDGMPILLMADAQTTGGYPIIGVVIGPDLPLAAQLLPGDRLRFQRATLDEARAAWQNFRRWRATLPDDDSLLLDWTGA